ncbi:MULTISPECIES: hypothetical protein [Myxococcaceae]|uniref:hypothetical protein n=1 Tax=Myxococcaceae TaxID=31 RepID=UPI002714ED86|nr:MULTISPECIES: hypothetical protein [Myxococcaceae]
MPSPAPAPRPLVAPRTFTPAPRPSGGAPGGVRPAGGMRPGGPPRPGGFSRPSVPRPPPTAEQVQALAVRERVPARIAKGELEGKMKCRIWRKLHAEEAKRFDQVYTLMAQHPGLSLPDGFGVVQSGMSVAEFLARKDRTQRKAAIKQARGAVDNEAVDAFMQARLEEKAELALVLGERTLLDLVTAVEPIALRLERSGRLEKLQLVLLARRADWEQLGPTFSREPKLSQKPAGVARQPDKRPYSDPRPFLAHLGQPLRLTLRNGIQLNLPLRLAGRFDLIVGDEGHELLVPLHAIVRFDAPESEGSPDAPPEGAPDAGA